MKYRIGIATTDGLVVNQHFGRAESFLIIDTDDEGNINVIEQRFVQPVCHGGNHNDDLLAENAERLSDCDYILVSKIGPGAESRLAQMGIGAYEIPGVIEESVKSLLSYTEIQNMLK